MLQTPLFKAAQLVEFKLPCGCTCTCTRTVCVYMCICTRTMYMYTCTYDVVYLSRTLLLDVEGFGATDGGAGRWAEPTG